jgi:hypothetical protein
MAIGDPEAIAIGDPDSMGDAAAIAPELSGAADDSLDEELEPFEHAARSAAATRPVARTLKRRMVSPCVVGY